MKSLVLVLFFVSGVVQARDLGFRFVDGQCVNESGEKGFNPNFFGQCSIWKNSGLGRVDLSEVDFSGSRFEGASFSESNFSQSKFHSVTILNSDFSLTDFSRVSAIDLEVKDSDFGKAIFAEADLLRVRFTATRLDEADFASTVLNKVSFHELGLRSSYFQESDLNQCAFEKVSLDQADFSLSSTTGLSVVGSSLRKVNLEEVEWSNVEFKESSLNQISFRRSKVAGLSIQGSQLLDSILEDFVTTDAKFIDSKIEDTVFSRMKFEGNTSFQRVRLIGGELSKVDLPSPVFEDVLVYENIRLDVDASLERELSKLPQVKFNLAVFDEPLFYLNDGNLRTSIERVKKLLGDQNIPFRRIRFDYIEKMEESMEGIETLLIPDSSNVQQLTNANYRPFWSKLVERGIKIVLTGTSISNYTNVFRNENGNRIYISSGYNTSSQTRAGDWEVLSESFELSGLNKKVLAGSDSQNSGYFHYCSLVDSNNIPADVERERIIVSKVTQNCNFLDRYKYKNTEIFLWAWHGRATDQLNSTETALEFENILIRLLFPKEK